MRYFFRTSLFALLGWWTSLINAEIRSILLVPSENEVDCLHEGLQSSPVINCDVVLPGRGQTLLDELQDKYVGGPLTEKELIKIKRAIIRYYRRENHPIVAVRILEVDKEKGIVAFVIKEGENEKLPRQNWFLKEYLEKYIDIQTEENIAQDVLLGNVAWLNRNPFRQRVVTLDFESREGTTDLHTHKSFPLQLYVGGDNAGNKFTGQERLYGGVTWDHVLGLPDFLHYQYTCNPNPHKFQSHDGSYISFLPWKHIVAFFADYSLTDHVPGFKSKGKFLSASVRYTMPFRPLNELLKQEITVGGDFKDLNTNVFFIDSSLPLRVPYIHITQLLVNYSVARAWKQHELIFAGELFFSPGKLIKREGNHDYHRLRPHAKNRYVYGKVTLSDVFQFSHGFTVAGLLRLQGSSQPLLPSEQFGLGGYNTVRGYGERIFNADEALCANGEFRFPSFGIMKKGRDELIFLSFIDYGLGYNLKPSPGNASHRYLLGVGAGARYQIDTHFSARMDYGFRLHRIPGDEHSGGKFHVGVEAIF